MPRQCPKCGRPFKHKNQEHSCVVVSVSQHLHGRPEKLVKAYQKLQKAVKNFSREITESPALNAILFTCNGTFLAVKFKKDAIVLEFFLPEERSEFPVFKTMRYTKTKVVHYVAIGSTNEIDKQLLGWIKESYQLTMGTEK